MKISVIGTGYVGLVTATCFAEMGNDVIAFDVDAVKIRLLEKGDMPIYEPGLQEMVRRNTAMGRLQFTTDAERSVRHGLIQFIAVGTPLGEDGSADVRHVMEAARSIAQYLDEYKVVVNKSTVPVGTTEKVGAVLTEGLARRRVDVPFSVVSNPEFLKEGAAIEDFMRPDRVVVGADDERAVQLMRGLYAPYLRNHDGLFFMDIRSAELTKYAANAMLATRISFMNDLANLAERLGADIEAVRLGLGADPRIGYHFLYAGCGYGGSCLPKDVRALIGQARDRGHDLRILGAVDAVNEDQKKILFRKIEERFDGDLRGKRIAVWGLAFKPGTDDMREAPSRVLVSSLLASGATICAYDPVAMPVAAEIFRGDPRIAFSDRPLRACEGADALAIVTECKEFRSPDFAAIKTALRTPVIVDGRNLYDPGVPGQFGLEYLPVGRSGSRGKNAA